MMNEEASNTNQNEQDAQYKLILSLGQMLKDARERSQMTIDDIADYLRISPSVVETIEADGYQEEDLTVYIRGYIRRYAALVNVAEKDVQQAFAHLGLKKIEKTDQHIKYEEFRPSSHDKRFKLITYLVVASLVLLVVLWHYSGHKNDNNIVTDIKALAVEPIIQQPTDNVMPEVSAEVDVQPMQKAEQPKAQVVMRKHKKKHIKIKPTLSQSKSIQSKIASSQGKPWINPDDLP